MSGRPPGHSANVRPLLVLNALFTFRYCTFVEGLSGYLLILYTPPDGLRGRNFGANFSPRCIGKQRQSFPAAVLALRVGNL